MAEVSAAVRVRPRFDYIPGMVAAGAGLTAGVLRAYGTGLPAWRMGAYEAGLIGAGVLGHFFGWNADLSYGLQVAGVYGLTEQIGPAIKAKSAVAIFSDIAVLEQGEREIARRRAAPHTSSGCSACAQAALRSPERANADIAEIAGDSRPGAYAVGVQQPDKPGPPLPIPIRRTVEEAAGVV